MFAVPQRFVSRSTAMTRRDWLYSCLALLLGLLLISEGVQAERLKDVATLAGVRSNPLLGYGLVVGLDGSGDQTTQTPFTVQSFRNMLREFGIVVPEGQRLQLKNVAAVSVHASLP